MPSIFISRILDINSPIYTLGASRIEQSSLLTFSAVSFSYSDLADYDWVFFYSKRAVRYFMSQVPQSFDKALACIGPATAKALEQYAYTADFVGDGNPSTTAADFVKSNRGKKVLFPRALHSRLSIQQLLAHQIEAFDLVVYQNEKRIDFDDPNADILIFTSPMNAAAYFDKIPLRKGQKIVAIGPTTAKALLQMGMNEIIIAAEPSEQGIAAVIKDFF